MTLCNCFGGCWIPRCVRDHEGIDCAHEMVGCVCVNGKLPTGPSGHPQTCSYCGGGGSIPRWRADEVKKANAERIAAKGRACQST